jgi:hypothetical protein
MLNAAHFTAPKTSDSTDRTPALAATRTITPTRPGKPVSRIGAAARRFLDALVRSLAAPHS